MNYYRVIYLAFVFSLASALSLSFHPSRHRALIPSLKSKLTDDEKNYSSQLEYNDDAFGLIFLSSFVVEHDNSFAATFGILSAFAAIFVRQRILQSTPLIPGLVALATLLVIQTPIFSNLRPDSISSLQAGSCILSFVWSVVKSKQLATKER
jgi:hypothetical protein